MSWRVCGGWWYSAIFRWPEFEFSLPSSVFGWNLDSRWLNFNFSIVNDVVWAFVTVLESLALLTMLCYFFLFCGCTL